MQCRASTPSRLAQAQSWVSFDRNRAGWPLRSVRHPGSGPALARIWHRATSTHIRSPLVAAAPCSPMLGAAGWANGTILKPTACFSPSWMRSRALDFGGADQARPNLVVSLIAWRDIPSSFCSPGANTPPAQAASAPPLQHPPFGTVLPVARHAASHLPASHLPARATRRCAASAHAAFSTAPSGTTPSCV